MKKLVAVIGISVISFYNMQAMNGDNEELEVVSSKEKSSKSVVVAKDSCLHQNYMRNVFESCLLLHDNIWKVRPENAKHLGKASRDILKSLQDHMSISYLGSDDRCVLFIDAIANARRCIYDLEVIYSKPDEWGPVANIHKCFSAPITYIGSVTPAIVTSMTPGVMAHSSSSFELDAHAVDDNDADTDEDDAGACAGASDSSQEQIIQPSSVEIAGSQTNKGKEKDVEEEEEIDFSDPGSFTKAQQYADASVFGIAQIIHESPQSTAEWKECARELERQKHQAECRIRARQRGNFAATAMRLAREGVGSLSSSSSSYSSVFYSTFNHLDISHSPPQFMIHHFLGGSDPHTYENTAMWRVMMHQSKVGKRQQQREHAIKHKEQKLKQEQEKQKLEEEKRKQELEEQKLEKRKRKRELEEQKQKLEEQELEDEELEDQEEREQEQKLEEQGQEQEEQKRKDQEQHDGE